MTINLLKEGVLTLNDKGIGEVSSEMLHRRAVELAIIDGRSEKEVSKSDYEMSERELAGEPDIDPKEALLEAAPESERWDPLPGSVGHRVPDFINDDEDSEGRSDDKALVEQGVREAEHDQMLQLARARREEADS